MGELWTLLILRPMVNTLVVLYWLLRSNFGLAIIFFTVLIRLLMVPLSLKQIRSMKAQQELQPELEALQKKYAQDKQRLAQEQMKFYRERGANPMGGCLPLLLQWPIWLGLYQSIYRVLGSTPEQLIDLYKQLYVSLPIISRIAQEAVRFKNRFLLFDLSRPDPFYIMPILVGASTWLVQKMMPSPSAGTGSQQTSAAQTMQVMMPIMMGFMTLQLPSGLAIYWVTSNVIQMVQQYLTTGWGGLTITGAGRRVEERKVPEEMVQETESPRRRKRRGGRKKKR